MNTKISSELLEEFDLEPNPFADVSFEDLQETFCWPLFELGEISISPLVANELTEAEVKNAIHKHGSGVWGLLGRSDWKANDFSLDAGFPVLSMYQSVSGTNFMVVTDFDRQLTEILLPKEL